MTHPLCRPLFAFVLAAAGQSMAPRSAVAEGLPPTLVDSLDGWKASALAHCWTLDDGVLTVENDPSKQASTLWTEKSYKDFVVELEFKFGEGVVDSGVFLRQENDQIQLGISGSLKRDLTASPYIGGKGYPIEAQGVAEVLKQDDWNKMVIVVVGDDYDVWLNGEHVTHYQSETAIESGPIGLQLHPGNTMTMQFRHVRIAELQ
ncbi:hypothetical protein Pla108_07730 [Botrimarina colliarenosi]|uniref:3-keto-alpha-glucoside-1,2-lyase/3-keto-2-hydroxy-glucal hydratase domain-containing protein n=1 Tax=Botrimarina colliarenosi TaxID=2528001 RepID=A0A5C6AK92_9BACT|nr:DUF1080 domain-containing protein [Botrimarina colliarenosi]TWT99830.1 hypothetical protein Pla108_07730 [Botrimarina colliarenosi]